MYDAHFMSAVYPYPVGDIEIHMSTFGGGVKHYLHTNSSMCVVVVVFIVLYKQRFGESLPEFVIEYM